MIYNNVSDKISCIHCFNITHPPPEYLSPVLLFVFGFLGSHPAMCKAYPGSVLCSLSGSIRPFLGGRLDKFHPLYLPLLPMASFSF